MKQCFKCKSDYDTDLKSPKILDCQHTLCHECVFNIYFEQNQIICPQCSVITVETPLQLKTLLLPEQHGKEEYCLIHPEEKSNLYCRNDSLVICSECAFANHNGHKINLASQVLEEIKANEYRESLVQKESQIKKLMENKLKIQSTKMEIEKQVQKYKHEIKVSAQELIFLINQTCQSRINLIESDQVKLENELQEQIEQIDNQISELQQIVIKDENNLNGLQMYIKRVKEVQSTKIKLKEYALSYRNQEQEIAEYLKSFMKYHLGEKQSFANGKIESIKQACENAPEVIRGRKHNQIVFKWSNYMRIELNSNILQSINLSVNPHFQSQIHIPNLQPIFGNFTSAYQISNSQLVLVGGYGTNNHLNHFLRIENNQIAQQTNLIIPRKDTSLTFDNRKFIFIIGGVDVQDDIMSSFESYDLNRNKPITLPDHIYKGFLYGTCYGYDLI